MKKIILFSIIVVLLAVGGVVIFMANRPGIEKGSQKSVPGSAAVNTATNAAAKMPETNPFKTKVNPMAGYTNPFSK